MKHKTELTSKSIDKLVPKKDLKDVISEYIWNGFDAGANNINIQFKYNELGALDSIYIKDNGHGIIYEELDSTFKPVLDSKKAGRKKGTNIHGSKGKGRFSFIALGEQAVWRTTYKLEDINQSYNISIYKSSSNEFEVTEKVNSDDCTGTELIITGISNINYDDQYRKKLENSLIEEFSWFLYLNKQNNYSIILNNEQLNYMKLIDEELSKKEIVDIDNYSFEINLIKWTGNIKEKYYSYYFNDKYEQIHKSTTSFNNKSLEFPHSVYIVSNYFNNFRLLNEKKELANQLSSNESKNQKDKAFKELELKIINIIKEQLKFFTKTQAPTIIDNLEKEGAFPNFKSSSKYDAMKKEDLKEVLIEICAVQPKIFTGSIENKKSIVGFLNLLLDTDEREGIINIMDSIASLTPNERMELNDVLKKTTLSKILKTVTSIQNRLKVIEALKKVVYSEKQFTNERDHIQNIIENNYWLFGEQYHLVSADVTFEKALSNYTYILDGYESESEAKISDPEKNRRPDIFMCRSRSVYTENSTELEENIIVELKAPKVVLTKKIYRQIEDYMLLISKEPRFNSSIRKWKFIMVSSEVNEDIESMYKSWESKGRRFMVNSMNNFEIYAMTWDDVFKSFEINHRYILEKLEFNKVLIKDEVDNLSDAEGRALVNEITKEILELKNRI